MITHFLILIPALSNYILNALNDVIMIIWSFFFHDSKTILNRSERSLKLHDSKIILRAIGGDIFEYCVGERKTFTEDESKNLTRQLAQALEFIHPKYIVHLDVKPQSILLSKGICFS